MKIKNQDIRKETAREEITPNIIIDMKNINQNKSEDKLHTKGDKQVNKIFISAEIVEIVKVNKNQAGSDQLKSLQLEKIGATLQKNKFVISIKVIATDIIEKNDMVTLNDNYLTFLILLKKLINY